MERSGLCARRALRRQQALVIALLFAGYAACYFCRADFAVATPLLIDELGAGGMSREAAMVGLGRLASAGVLAYAVGKLFLTGIGDVWGGKLSFLVGVGGATFFTFLFGAAGVLPVFTLAWLGNRLTQSVAWAGLIKVSSRWFDYTAHGAVIGVLSVSYLVGDALARALMGWMLHAGFGWRALFVMAGSVAGVVFLANVFLLRATRSEAGFAEPTIHPENLYARQDVAPSGIRAVVRPLLTSPAFLVVCGLSLGCTIVRETFNIWTPVYLRDHLGYAMTEAAVFSAVFPAVGAVSVIVAGWWSDRIGPSGRAVLLCAGLSAATVALLLLTLAPASAGGSVAALAAIGLVAFCLLGPYSYLGGALALDFGGRHAGAAASGLIDGVGYLGAVLAGDAVARLAVAFGWRGVFVALAAVCALSSLGAAVLLVMHFRRQRPALG
jgi:sugar phosphate permease